MAIRTRAGALCTLSVLTLALLPTVFAAAVVAPGERFSLVENGVEPSPEPSLSPQVVKHSTSSPNCTICQTDAASCPRGCAGRSIKPAPAHGSQRAARSASPRPSEITANASEAPVSCWVCELTGTQCPAYCDRARGDASKSPSPTPPSPQARRIGESGDLAGVVESMRPANADPAGGAAEAPENCWLCRERGAQCPRGCDRGQVRASASPAPPSACDICREEGTACPASCNRAPQPACDVCGIKGVPCREGCAKRGATKNSVQPSNAASPGSTLKGRVHGNGTRPDERPEPSASGSDDGASIAPSLGPVCALCRRNGVQCPAGCDARPESAPMLNVPAAPINCWECVQRGVQCHPSCPDAVGAQGVEGNQTCWTCRTSGVQCPIGCGDGGSGPGPAERVGNCWLCRSLREACPADCHAAKELLPRKWAFRMESSCWLCGEFPWLCPNMCRGWDVTETFVRQDMLLDESYRNILR